MLSCTDKFFKYPLFTSMCIECNTERITNLVGVKLLGKLVCGLNQVRNNLVLKCRVACSGEHTACFRHSLTQLVGSHCRTHNVISSLHNDRWDVPDAINILLFLASSRPGGKILYL